MCPIHIRLLGPLKGKKKSAAKTMSPLTATTPESLAALLYDEDNVNLNISPLSSFQVKEGHGSDGRLALPQL